MHFVLVPFLLSQLNNSSILFGIRVADNDLALRHGQPEHTFNMTYISCLEPKSDSPAEKSSQNWGTNFVGKLKCRPYAQEPRLHCHFNCTKFVKLTSKTYKAAVDGLLEDVNYTNLDFGDASFEISSEGIEEYKFNEKLEADESLQKLYKLITGNLYLSSMIDMSNCIKRVDNTSVGECPVTYEMKSKKLENVVKNKEFVVTKSLGADLEEIIDIKRQVHVDECTSQQNYFTGDQQIHDFIPADSDIKLESSTSRVYVTPQNFTSEMVNTFNVGGPNKAPIGTLHEHFRVQLDQVNLVKRELRTLPNLSTLA